MNKTQSFKLVTMNAELKPRALIRISDRLSYVVIRKRKIQTGFQYLCFSTRTGKEVSSTRYYWNLMLSNMFKVSGVVVN